MTIQANLRAYVQSGIQTGQVDELIADLSPLQRQLLEANEFHFAGGALLKKKDPILEPNEAADFSTSDIEATQEHRAKIRETLASVVHNHSKESRAGYDNLLPLESSQGVDVYELVLEEEERLRSCKKLATALLNDGEFKEFLLTESYAIALIDFFAGDLSYDDAFEAITLHLFAEGEVESQDALDHLEDINNPNYMTMLGEGDSLIKVNLISLNSQFGGKGYSPPRDSYKVVRILRYDNETTGAIDAKERKGSARVLIGDIHELVTDEIKDHYMSIASPRNPKSLYSQDKEWAAKWSDQNCQEEIGNMIHQLLYGRLETHIKQHEHRYSTYVDGRNYYCYVTQEEEPTLDSWVDASAFTKAPTSIAQKAQANYLTGAIIPDSSVRVRILPKVEPETYVTEEKVRRLVNRAEWRWNQDRLNATKDLNFTKKQWGRIFDAYRDRREELTREAQTEKKPRIEVQEDIKGFTKEEYVTYMKENMNLLSYTQYKEMLGHLKSMRTQ